jgi:peptide/nickel transport system permease protein
VIGYILRRIGTSIVVLIGVSIFIFGLLHAIYPSPAIDVLGDRANSVLVAAWNKQNGFDDPWITQYLRYMGNLLRGNLGYSYKLNQGVWARCGRAAPGSRACRWCCPS